MKIDEAKLLIDQALATLNKVRKILGSDDDEPQPDAIIVITISTTKANAFWAPESNAAEVPIMEIYPANDSPVGKRVQYAQKDRIQIFEEPVRADGGAIYYKIAEPTIRNRSGEKVLYADLYLRAKDIKLP